MSTLSLYQCERAIAEALDAALDRETGEIVSTDELNAAIGAFNAKAPAVAAYILNMQAEVDAMRLHETAIKARRTAHESRIERLREYMATCMSNAAIHEVKANDGTFTARLLRERDEAVEIDETAPFDPRFIRETVRRDWDKTALKKAIKAGEPVPDCVKLVKRDRLEIK